MSVRGDHRSWWVPALPPAREAADIRIWHSVFSAAGGYRVALIHGMEGTWASWGPLTRRLRRRYDVVSLDLPWRAGSTYSWPHHGNSAVWLGQALERLTGPADVLIAHSFGASTLLQVLATREVPCRAVVLVAPLYRPAEDWTSPTFYDEAVARFRAVMREGVCAELGPRAARLSPDVLDLMLRNVLRRVEPYGFLQLYSLLCGLAALPLHAVRVPVLIVNGPTDPSAPPEAVRTLARRLPAGRLAQRDAFRHFCQLDQAEEVSVLVNGFLDEVLPATGPIPVPATVPTDGTRFAAVAGRGRSEP